MGSIIFLDKNKAEILKSKGFAYIKSTSSDGKELYKFIDTIEIRNILSSEFDKNDFIISRTVNF